MIIAVEGQSYAGKTTLINTLSNPPLIQVVPELIDYCGGPASFPQAATTEQEAIENDGWFLAQEKKRIQSINDKPGTVLMADRWFLSGLAYSFARDHITGYHTFKRNYEATQKSLDDRELFLPAVIYVRLPIESVITRQTKTIRNLSEDDIPGNLMHAQTRESFITWQEHFYDLFSVAYKGHTLVLDGRNDLKSNAFLVNNWIRNPLSNHKAYDLPEISNLLTDPK